MLMKSPPLKISLWIRLQSHLRTKLKLNSVLSPFKRLLKSLITCGPNDLKKETIPAKLWLESTKKSIKTIPALCRLPRELRSQIGSLLLSENIHIFGSDSYPWRMHLPFQISRNHLKNDPKYKGLTREALVESLGDSVYGYPIRVNADRRRCWKCLEHLEAEMFEVSKRAGIVGHYQWGLNAGDRQDWDPYAGMQDLNFGNREGSESELEVGHSTSNLQCLTKINDNRKGLNSFTIRN